MIVQVKVHSIDGFIPFANSDTGSGYTKAIVEGERYPVNVVLTFEQYETSSFPAVVNAEVWPKVYEKNGQAKPTMAVRLLSLA